MSSADSAGRVAKRGRKKPKSAEDVLCFPPPTGFLRKHFIDRPQYSRIRSYPIMTESNRKPAPHMPDPPVSTALSRASDALTYRITSTIAATLQFLVSTGIKKPWSQRVAKDWDEANLSPQARAFLHLLYMSKSPVKSVQDTRVKTDGLAALVTCNSPYNVERLRIPGSDVPIEIVRSASHPQLQHKGAMLWTHGGAYIAGRAFAYNGPLAEVSSRLGGIDVVLVDYRLAPEADLLEETIGDCLEAYRWCVEKYGAENLVIGGDSVSVFGPTKTRFRYRFTDPPTFFCCAGRRRDDRQPSRPHLPFFPRLSPSRHSSLSLHRSLVLLRHHRRL